MVESGQPIPSLPFRAPDGRLPGFEIVDLAALRRRGRTADGVHRVEFHTITLVVAGRGEHAIDFVTHACRPGTLLWARPGQVQRYVRPGSTAGTHILFTPDFTPAPGGHERLVAAWRGRACWHLRPGRDLRLLVDLAEQLRREYDRPGAGVSGDVIRMLLGALLLHVDRLPHDGRAPDPAAGGELYARFREDLERRYATTRRAADYADRLGYSVKTLNRACVAATGEPVKRVIDRRVALEAQRLLAHGDEPVAVIADRLGFGEPTNFGKFFARQLGLAPGAFRALHRPPR